MASAALAAEGLDVSLVVPLHRGMQDAFVPLEEIEPLRIRLHDGVEEARVRRALDEPAGVRVYGIEALPYFDRPSLYGESGSDYADNARRFTVFCRAVLAALPRLGSLPDVIHCHEWQTALIPAYLRGGIAGDDDAMVSPDDDGWLYARGFPCRWLAGFEADKRKHHSYLATPRKP